MKPKLTAIILTLALAVAMMSGCDLIGEIGKLEPIMPKPSEAEITPTKPSETEITPPETETPTPPIETETETETNTEPPTEPPTTPADADPVRIVIKNGKAELMYDLDKWNEIYGIYKSHEKSEYYAGPYTVNTKRGNVTEACVGIIKNFGKNSIEPNTQTAFFLMEDGTVEYAYPPYPHTTSDSQHITESRNALYWIQSIESLSLEKDSDGTTDKIYAIDADGTKHDVSIPIALTGIGWGMWLAKISSEYECEFQFINEYRCAMRFTKIGVAASKECAEYEGTYKLIMDDSDGNTPGTIRFSAMSNVWGNGDVFKDLPGNITGEYKIDLTRSSYGSPTAIEFKLISGDKLFDLGKTHPSKYEFEYEFEFDPPVSSAIYDFLLGSWECLTPGELTCKWDIYQNHFNRTLEYYVMFFYPDSSRAYGLDVMGDIESSSWWGGTDYDDNGQITLYIYRKARDPETYWFTRSGFWQNFTIHKGNLLMGIYTDAEESIFRDMGYDETVDSFMFAKFIGDMEQGKPIKNVDYAMTFWEYDSDKNIIWLDNREFFLEHTNTINRTAPYPISPAATLPDPATLRPGATVNVETNSKGEITHLELTQFDEWE